MPETYLQNFNINSTLYSLYGVSAEVATATAVSAYAFYTDTANNYKYDIDYSATNLHKAILDTNITTPLSSYLASNQTYYNISANGLEIIPIVEKHVLKKQTLQTSPFEFTDEFVNALSTAFDTYSYNVSTASYVSVKGNVCNFYFNASVSVTSRNSHPAVNDIPMLKINYPTSADTTLQSMYFIGIKGYTMDPGETGSVTQGGNMPFYVQDGNIYFNGALNVYGDTSQDVMFTFEGMFQQFLN